MNSYICNARSIQWSYQKNIINACNKALPFVHFYYGSVSVSQTDRGNAFFIALYIQTFNWQCETKLKVADPRITVAGLHPYLTRTVTSRNRRSFDCSTLKIFKNHSRRANSRATRLLLSPVGATMYSRAATRPSKVWAASSTVWNASTRTDKINDHGFIRIEARASLEESGRLFLVHVV